MKKLLCLLCLFPTLLSAQKQLVRPEELVFNSEFEKQILTDHFTNQKTDYFKLFVANGAVLNENAINASREKVHSFIATYNNDKFRAKKSDKKVKTLYSAVHETFLSKYENKNRFEDIFDRGYYNCVSATALYGIIFHELEIPFNIKESPDHVYLIAYPDQERVIVEATAPNLNFVTTINPQLKENFVKMMKAGKLISQSEANSLSTDALFDKYYFRDQSNITLLQLTGIQYANDGLYLLEEKRFPEAFNQFQKAYLFYPTERNGYLSMVAGVQALTNHKRFDETHATLLGKLSRYDAYGITAEMIKGDLQNAIQEILFNKGEKELLSVYYDRLMHFITDASLKSELDFNYNYELGRFYYNQARYREAMPYFENALTQKPNHLQATSIFISTASSNFRNKPNSEVLSTLETYRERYPVLSQNNIFNEMLSLAYLKEFQRYYEESDPANGEKYRLLFESFYKEHQDVELDHYSVGKSYGAAAAFFFKKGQQSKAKGVVMQGLTISPDNYELKMRSRMLN
ncbi:MAG TPA: hypothetical protein VD927_09355 [Chryseosolibacter sp.]|nr:hypothetical protein [Chryseosolibacter sp.]